MKTALKGVLTSFGKDGQTSFCTGQVWLQSEGKIYRMPVRASGLVGQAVYARVHTYATPNQEALYNTSANRPIAISGFAIEYRILDEPNNFRSGPL